MVTTAMESGGASPLPAANPLADVPFEQRRTKICVYCGSSPGSKPEHMEAARQLARVMAANNIQLGESGPPNKNNEHLSRHSTPGH